MRGSDFIALGVELFAVGFAAYAVVYAVRKSGPLAGRAYLAVMAAGVLALAVLHACGGPSLLFGLAGTMTAVAFVGTIVAFRRTARTERKDR